ncbi:hypothetical protein [Scytonema sp. NUACC26]|uniref:hypothetical protein n=1 Tax=Scytonema sp. NUACC26 TaxID=3140176 RepID=UPI0038B37C23
MQFLWYYASCPPRTGETPVPQHYYLRKRTTVMLLQFLIHKPPIAQTPYKIAIVI